MGVLDRGAARMECGLTDEDRPLESYANFEVYALASDDRSPITDDRSPITVTPPWPPAEAALELTPWLLADDPSLGLRG